MFKIMLLISLEGSMANLGFRFKSALNRSRKLQQFIMPVVKRR